MKIGFQKIVNLLDMTSDDKDLPRFVTKNGLKFMINQKKIITLTKKLELKHQCWDKIYVILVMRILLWKELLLLKKMLTEIMMSVTNNSFLKTMPCLSTAFQRQIVC